MTWTIRPRGPGSIGMAVTALAFAAFARDYWTGVGLYTLVALTLGATYTIGILLIAENVPTTHRARAMGAYLAGHSVGLARALVLAGDGPHTWWLRARVLVARRRAADRRGVRVARHA